MTERMREVRLARHAGTAHSAFGAQSAAAVPA
jgi:hypothetical protein